MTPEAQQAERMKGACNRVYQSVFGIDEDAIERFAHGEKLFILDQEFAVDVRIRLPNGSNVTGQEKTLSNKFYSFKTFTMEFYQNRFSQLPGEFFKIASQFYLSGYSDESGVDFIEWKMIDLFKLMYLLKDRSESDMARQTRPSTSKASFWYIHYDQIPDDCILFESSNVLPQQDDSISAWIKGYEGSA